MLLNALELKAGDVVADVGAGSGYFSWRMAQKVGPTGKIFANDIQPEMLELLMAQMRKRNVEKIVEPILGTVQDPKLPENSTDLILLVDVYHELDFPFEMTRAMIKGLKPGGRLVLVEYRAIRACAAAELPAATTVPAPSLPTGRDCPSRPAMALMARSGTDAVTTGNSAVPEYLAVDMSAAPKSSPMSDGLMGVACTRNTISSAAGSGVGVLTKESSSSHWAPVCLISERS